MKLIASLVVLISLVSPALSIEDRVNTIPASPLATQPFEINLFDASGCCCGIVHTDSIATLMQDTAILLSYAIDEEPCLVCRCLSAGITIKFTSAALKAGTYSVYKHKSEYCAPNQFCQDIYTEPVKVGTITITASPTAISHRPQRPTLKRQAVLQQGTYSINGQRVSRVLKKEDNVHSKIYRP